MKKLQNILSFLIFLVMLGMVFSVSWQIFTRFVIHQPNIWTEEATRIFLIYITFLGAGLAMMRGDNVRVTVIADRLPPNFQAILSLLMNLFSIVFLLFVVWYSFPLMHRLANQPMPVLRFSKSLVYLALPLGALSMILVLGERVLQSAKVLLDHYHLTEDHK